MIDANTPPPSCPRVVVKFRDEVNVPSELFAVANQARGLAADPVDWSALQQRFPGIRISLLFGEHGRDALQSIDATNLLTYVALDLPAGCAPGDVIDEAGRLSGVEEVYLEEPPGEPPTFPVGANPLLPTQGQLAAAPAGIDARAAWAMPGGTGEGTGFIDIEQGWQLGHEDLVGSGVTLASGVNKSFFFHGTRMLGIVLGQDNAVGVVGISPQVSPRVVSEWRTAGTFNRASAIVAATLLMSRGDVLLLESQSGPGPIEHERAVFDAIVAATSAGIHVIEPAGNFSTDLDTWTDAAGKFILNRNHADFRGDSGAIMVGCCTSAVPHRRLPQSGFGSRIDCYAWGQNVVTTDTDATGTSTTMYTNGSNSTSAASAIIAGVVCSFSSMIRARVLIRLRPGELRTALTRSTNGTASGAPATDRIGIMPDLAKLIANEVMRYIVDTGPMPVYAGGPIAFLDPGHGGADARGRSSALGCRGPGGTLEKDVNLTVARQVRRHLGGGVAMSRDGDHNLSLRDRVEAARRSGAPVVISLHANAGEPGRRGAEVWVHGDGRRPPDPRALALAHAIGGELGAAQRLPVPVLVGNLATIDPAHHVAGVAACHVEVDYLSSRDGEARLTDPRTVDVLGGAIARGVRTFLGTRA